MTDIFKEVGPSTPTGLGLVIGTDVQAWDTQLDDIAALSVGDGNFIVGNGSNWVVESGATVRASLGVYSTTETDGKYFLNTTDSFIGTLTTTGNLVVNSTSGAPQETRITKNDTGVAHAYFRWTQTGTPTINDSSLIEINHDSDTTPDSIRSLIIMYTTDPVHATRGSKLAFLTTNNGLATEGLVVESNQDVTIPNGSIINSAMLSGATQGAAGAGVGELWKTASHATLPDNVVMIGV